MLVEKEAGAGMQENVVHDTITGLEAKTHFGRPQFNKLFGEMTQRHPNTNVRVRGSW